MQDAAPTNIQLPVVKIPPIKINKAKTPQQARPKTTLTKYSDKELQRLNNLKITPIKQKRIINLYSQSSNLNKVAKKVGISLRAIYKTMERDPEFKEQIENIRLGFCEDMKDAMVLNGTIPDAQGQNDRHRYLQAYDPAFAKNTEIQINQQFNLLTSEIDGILDKFKPEENSK